MKTLFAQFLTRGMNILGVPWYIHVTSDQIRLSLPCNHSFSFRHSMLAAFSQGFSVRNLMRTFWKFMGRHPELASKFDKRPSSMICDTVPVAQLYHIVPPVDKIVLGIGCCVQGRSCLLLGTPDAITE